MLTQVALLSDSGSGSGGGFLLKMFLLQLNQDIASNKVKYSFKFVMLTKLFFFI